MEHRSRPSASAIAVIILLLIALLMAFTNPRKEDFVDYALLNSGVSGLQSNPVKALALRAILSNATVRSDYAVVSTYRLGLPSSEAVFLGVMGQFVKLRGDLSMPSSMVSEPVRVKITTGRGEFTMELYPDLMPNTVANFLRLVNSEFYDGLSFHRVEDWVVQGGDPKGDGTGGPGWAIDFETSSQLTHERGAVGMARRSDDRNSAGSQFYIVKREEHRLDGEYAIFGRVVEGMSIVDRLQRGDEILSAVVMTP
jgi:cyclophilin family peptidyl-prolyl cis-trans isomerase